MLAFAWTGTAQTPQPLQLRNPVQGQVEVAANAAARANLFAIEVAQGQFFQVDVRKNGVDVLVTLADPSGKTILTADSPGNPTGQLIILWIAADAGRYSVRISLPDRARQPGPYQIEWKELREPIANDRIRVDAQAKLYQGAAQDRTGNREGRAAAIALYKDALEIRARLNQPPGIEEAYCLRRIGQLLSEAGDQIKAIESLEKALAIQTAVRDQPAASIALSALGAAHARQGDQLKSLHAYERQLEIQRSLRDRSGQAASLNSIGYINAALGEQQKMLAAFLEVLAIRRALGDRSAEARALNSVASAYYAMGEQQKVLDCYEQVLAIRRALGDRPGEAQTLSALGSLYRDLGAEQKALEFYQQSLAVGRAAGDSSHEADTQTGIGDVYFFLGEKQKSLAAYQRAADLKRAAADKSGEALALIGTANVLSDLASRQKAADSEGDAGRRKGLEYYEKSLAIGRAAGDFSVQVFALMGAGVAYSALGDKTKATEYLNQALFFFGTAQFKPGEGWARYELARVERDRGNLAKALSLAGNARDIIESLRSKVISQDLRATFFAAVHDCFGLEVDVLMRMHAADPTKNIQADALAASERARARVLLETLGESQADIRQGAEPALLDQERELQALLNAKETARIQMLGARQPPELAKKMQTEVRDLAAQYEEVNNKIRASSPRYAALKFPQPLALKQIQEQVLDADTLLLEYALGDQRSFLWVVSTEGMTSWTLPKRSVIEEAARRYHASLIDPNKPASAESTKALSRMLLGEAAGVLGRKRLVIVADGALQYLPFAALLDPEGWQQPLVVNHEIVNLPSASTLAVLRRENANRKPAPKALAILADPVFTPDDPRVARALAGNRARESSKAVERSVAQRSVNDLGLEGIQLPRLPGTRREASGIAALVPEADRIQALDFDATRAVLTGPDAGQYRIIHLATHGLLNTTHPELSGIVLSLVDRQGKPQNGFLRLYEIYNLKLGADLVVLSACQTGLGKEIQGEGLVGLTRGFMYAGAPRVLASLWKVDDRATAELMKRLYGTMLGPNPLPPAAALRAAQIEMWKNKSFENPYYWAAFTLQGEWR